MSIDQNQASQPEGDQQQSNGSSQEAEKFVPRKAYEEVTSDMHKYKSQLKDMKAELEQIRAERKAQEEATLIENQKFQELYERAKQENQKLLQDLSEKEEHSKLSAKLSRLKAELGGTIRDEYLQFADLSGIVITEDGSISPDSVREVANKFRQDHPSLLPSAENLNINEKAPSIGGVQEISYEEALKKVTNQKEFDQLRIKYGRS